MEINTDEPWKSKCSMNKFDIEAALREILTDQFGIEASNISLIFKIYQKSSFTAKIIDIKSTGSCFPDEKTFKASLKLNEKAKNGENNNFGDGRKSPLMIFDNVLVAYGDKQLNLVDVYYSYSEKDTLPKKFKGIKEKKILRSHEDCETFIRIVIYKSSKKDITGIRAIHKCIHKPMGEIDFQLDPENQEIFEKKR